MNRSPADRPRSDHGRRRLLRSAQPAGWPQDWDRLYGFTLEAIQEAEHLGPGSVWLSEHHLFEDGYLNQPLTYAAAVATRTSTIRIGTAVLIAPFWDPVHLAEQATVVDLISRGRLELGLGAGYRAPEYQLFGKSPQRRWVQTETALQRMREVWPDPRHLPHPHQSPVPVWLGYMGPKGAARAGRLGEGLLSVSRDLHEPYLTGLREGGHGDQAARMKGPLFGYVTEDPERDWPVVSKHFAYQQDSYRRYSVEGTDTPAPRPVDPDRARAAGLTGNMTGFGFGTPADIAARTKELVDGLPVESVFFWASIAGMPEDMVIEHIRTICTMLAPLL